MSTDGRDLGDGRDVGQGAPDPAAGTCQHDAHREVRVKARV